MFRRLYFKINNKLKRILSKINKSNDSNNNNNNNDDDDNNNSNDK